MTNSGGFLALSRRKPLQRRRRLQPRKAASEISDGSKHSDGGNSHSLISARRPSLSRLPFRDPENRFHFLRASIVCDRFTTSTEDAGTPVARCDFTLQLVQLSARRGRLRVLAGVKTDERSGGCDCVHSVPLRSPGTQRPAESACQIRSKELRDLQVGGRSVVLIIKMNSAQ